MTPDKLAVLFTGVTSILFTYWFFLMKPKRIVQASGEIDIIVQGGYSPESIAIPKDQTTTLRFLRQDPSSCLEEVVLPDFKIKRHLPVGKVVPIEITPHTTGTFDFACGMNMYHGSIIVQ